MTREQVLAMKPGRDMDVLVARKVTGWTDVEPIGPVYIGRPPDMKPVYPVDARFVPCYSTDIAAAMDIVPAMAKRGWDFALYYEAASGQWSAYFLCNSDEDTGATATASSLPEAVSKAPLLALLEEGDAT